MELLVNELIEIFLEKKYVGLAQINGTLKVQRILNHLEQLAIINNNNSNDCKHEFIDGNYWIGIIGIQVNFYSLLLL